jgi:hypothetical protein
MSSASHCSLPACRLLLHVLLAAALLFFSAGGRKGDPASTGVPPDDWEVPQLAAYLNGKGLGLRMVPIVKGGTIRQTAFLTTTSQRWDFFNHLMKDPKQMDRWQGTLYCERAPHWASWGDPTLQSGECCLVIGPFFLFGDRELLGRVRDAFPAACDR